MTAPARPTLRAAAIPAPWRALAVLLALLVLGAQIAAHAPALHDRLHACPDSAPEAASAHEKGAPAADAFAHDACAVALLAQGVTAAPNFPVLSAPRLIARPCALTATLGAPLAPPSHRLPPAQAPPAAA